MMFAVLCLLIALVRAGPLAPHSFCCICDANGRKISPFVMTTVTSFPFLSLSPRNHSRFQGAGLPTKGKLELSGRRDFDRAQVLARAHALSITSHATNLPGVTSAAFHTRISWSQSSARGRGPAVEFAGTFFAQHSTTLPAVFSNDRFLVSADDGPSASSESIHVHTQYMNAGTVHMTFREAWCSLVRVRVIA